MTANALLLLAADLVAITILAFGIFLPRHHRSDLAGAFLAVNIGVYAVASVLSSTDAGLGVGLGLFGVLSIIRLRSSEISQREIAYYFASLALGLIAGLGTSAPLVQLALLGLVLLALFLGDHPALARRSRRLLLVLDRAVLDEEEARAHVEALADGRVRRLTVRQTDFVSDTSTVEVRISPSAPASDRRGLPGPRTASCPNPLASTGAER